MGGKEVSLSFFFFFFPPLQCTNHEPADTENPCKPIFLYPQSPSFAFPICSSALSIPFPVRRGRVLDRLPVSRVG
ncbi:hypothetical protein HOY80DRAFT_386418 [Tuber brumale]|nr:hypothetical protein HOY80DRAFT_386418 [Tuber brumale]